jgi:protein-S-isoprenylcysteine O-methyltransferase Ste14
VTWVAAQTALMAAIVVSWFFPPQVDGGVAVWAVAATLVAVGAVTFVWARIAMGSSFTIRPQPRAGGELVTGGPFRLVRHPIYLGVLLALVGGSLFHSWTGLGLTAVLAVLWAGKARVEERNLSVRFPEYAAYRARVRYRIVPFLY